MKRVRYLAATNRSEISHTNTLSIYVNNGHSLDENWFVRFNAYRRRRKPAPRLLIITIVPDLTAYAYVWHRCCRDIDHVEGAHLIHIPPAWCSYYHSKSWPSHVGRRHLPALRTDFSLHNGYHQTPERAIRRLVRLPALLFRVLASQFVETIAS